MEPPNDNAPLGAINTITTGSRGCIVPKIKLLGGWNKWRGWAMTINGMDKAIFSCHKFVLVK